MARQIKNGVSWKPKEQRRRASRTNLLGIVKNVFKVTTPKTSGESPQCVTRGKTQNVEATARGPEGLPLRRAQMLR